MTEKRKVGRPKKIFSPKEQKLREKWLKLRQGDFLDIDAITLILPFFTKRMIKYYAQQRRMPFKMGKIRHTWYAKKEDVERYIAQINEQFAADEQTGAVEQTSAVEQTAGDQASAE